MNTTAMIELIRTYISGTDGRLIIMKLRAADELLKAAEFYKAEGGVGTGERLRKACEAYRRASGLGRVM